MFWVTILCLWLTGCQSVFVRADDAPRLASERVVISTTFGDVHFGFFPDVRHHHGLPISLFLYLKLSCLVCCLRVDGVSVGIWADTATARLCSRLVYVSRTV